MSIRNLIEDIQNFIAEDAAPKKVLKPLKNQPDTELSADDKPFTDALEVCVSKTRAFIRDLEKIEEVAAKVGEAASEMEKMRRAGQTEKAFRRGTDIANSMRKFDAEVRSLYGDFAEGRDALGKIASMAGLSTRRSGGAKKKEKPEYGKMTTTDLMQEIHKIGADLHSAVLKAGELGARSIRLASELLDADDSLKGEELKAKVTTLVDTYLDFRDQVSAGLFGMINGVSNRYNELGSRAFKRQAGEGLRRRRATEEAFLIDLSYLSEDDDLGWIVAGNVLSEAKKKRSFMETLAPEDKEAIVEACGKWMSEMNEMTSDALDEAGCAYAAMESLHEMYGEPEMDYGDESEYTGEE